VSFVSLQETLRKELRKRIEQGQLTGMELARRTRFTQAHISNFLNRKRGLKLSALDRVLKAIGLTLYDLLDPRDLVRFAAVPPGSDAEYADIALVSPEVASKSEVIVNEDVQELFKVKRTLLARMRPDLATRARRSWTRCVLIKLDPKQAASLRPRIGPNAVLLLDRHYNSLRPYHKNERNLYAVRKPEGLVIRHVELGDKILVLRPHNPETPVEVLAIPENLSASDLIIGRVAYIASEV
jgi:transcriptional regulator with XRE-family HTH domain